MQPVPAVNVNIRSTHAHPERANPAFCDSDCAPVLIPCPIPRSLTFTVRLGDCSGRCNGMMWQNPPFHGADCPGRPIRVSCSILGKTWEESGVVDVDPPGDGYPSILRACRERWALMKALMLGFTRVTLGGVSRQQADKLFVQRDAVYAALADKARVEQADDATTRALIKALPSLKARDGDAATASAYLSVRALAHYVEHLVEQIGVLQ